MTVTLTHGPGEHIATLRFTTEHPLNVLDTPTLEELLATVERTASERDLRVLLLTGNEQAFSGGADLDYLGALDDAAYRHYIATEYRLFSALETLPLITVAVIAGPCIGNATELALACDFRICSTDARLGLPEMRVGFVAPAQRLTAYVGIGRAKELLYSGRILTAVEAHELGLVTSVADDLTAESERSARRFAAYAPFALPYTKNGIHRCYGITGAERAHDAAEQDAALATFRGPDFPEGAAAALSGRKAQFTGRRAP